MINKRKCSSLDWCYLATIEPTPPWGTHDKKLFGKLKKLYEARFDEWLVINNGALHAQKWHVGREMLNWLYREGRVSADEMEALQVKFFRPKKGNVEFYRLVWKDAGRSSSKVETICTAPRTGPSKGYTRGELEAVELKAQEERIYGDGGWLYAYAYETSLRQSDRLGEIPLLKVGHTGGGYGQRIASQVKGTAIPDSPIVLRAYRVSDSKVVESRVHARLVSMGRHHRKAGGAEWFQVRVAELDQIVSEIAGNEASSKPVA